MSIKYMKLSKNEDKGGDKLLYEKIKREADKQGISISALERKAGLGNATIKGWNKSSPSVRNLCAVAEALGVSIEYFLDDAS